jgi:hypothetical protein
LRESPAAGAARLRPRQPPNAAGADARGVMTAPLYRKSPAIFWH